MDSSIELPTDNVEGRFAEIDADVALALQNAKLINEQVLSPMKSMFVGKDEVIDLLGVCLAARENLFILGPPGTAKSALVQTMARSIEGQVFDYLLTQFTEPNEVFGPFDIRQLRDGNLVTNTEGMLPEASFVFLDELLNANSAILNSLLMVLNERVFRRGRETRKLPALLFVGASNRLPEDEALGALFDRFLLRVQCDNAADNELQDVLTAGWKLEHQNGAATPKLKTEQIESVQKAIAKADLSQSADDYRELVLRLRSAGVALSDRRAVKLQRLIAASAFLCGRHVADASDCWVLRYVWDNVEQQSVVETIVQRFVDNHKQSDEDNVAAILKHPRSLGQTPDPNQLAQDINLIISRAPEEHDSATRMQLRDRLNVLAGSCAWIADAQQREYLEQQIELAWKQLGEAE